MTTEQTNTNQKEHGEIVDEGSPITVGGGGGIGENKVTQSNMSCVFKETDYPEPPGNPDKKEFRHPGWQIMTFKIGTNAGVVDHSDLLPDNGNCIIVIHCEGDRDDVTINGKHFGIDMDTRTYRKDLDPTVHTNPNADSFISRVDLITPGKNPESWFFNQDDNCAVCTDHVPDGCS